MAELGNEYSYCSTARLLGLRDEAREKVSALEWELKVRGWELEERKRQGVEPFLSAAITNSPQLLFKRATVCALLELVEQQRSDNKLLKHNCAFGKRPCSLGKNLMEVTEGILSQAPADQIQLRTKHSQSALIARSFVGNLYERLGMDLSLRVSYQTDNHLPSQIDTIVLKIAEDPMRYYDIPVKYRWNSFYFVLKCEGLGGGKATQ